MLAVSKYADSGGLGECHVLWRSSKRWSCGRSKKLERWSMVAAIDGGIARAQLTFLGPTPLG